MSRHSLTTHHPTPAVSESIYRHCIPDFAAKKLDDLYGNLHSSLATLNFIDLCDTSTYVKWTAEKNSTHVESIFLFQKLGQSLRVVNEGMRLKKTKSTIFASTFLPTMKKYIVSIFMPWPHLSNVCHDRICAGYAPKILSLLSPTMNKVI